ncbi:MAG TPA: prepilin-type N-terminal cleavage/methylation domain-containing protein [Rubrivivax sp.]|nr:prepilin-type N-terminal cleavage/methylation domain-containing protein [Rubrivivax sp.]
MRQPASLHRGFTLVEVLVALSILAVLAAMAWRGIDGMVRARDISQSQLERSLRLATVMAQWDQDLAALFDTPAVPYLSFDGSTLRMVRRAAGGVQLVAWSHQGTQWLRWAGPVVTHVAELQESWLRSQQLSGGEAGQLLLLDEVSEVEIQFFRGNGWSNPQSSGDVDAAAPGGRAQREATLYGVRLVLAFDTQQLTRDVALSLQQP